MKYRSLLRLPTRPFCKLGSKVAVIPGNSTLKKDTLDVSLRGLYLKGNQEDLPSLIFFPDYFDTPESWLPFFLNPKQKILNHRNVYILYPRNFGSSDYCEVSEEQDLAADVERFMYTNQITMATLGGHGMGAKTATLVGCYRPELVTGLLGLDYAPQSYQFFEFVAEIRKVITHLSKLNMERTTVNQVKEAIESLDISPRLMKMMSFASKRAQSGVQMSFNLPHLISNFNDFFDWKVKAGLFGGRANFIFPEYSNRVFIGSNTLSMHKIVPTLNGYLSDIFAIKGSSDNPEKNHWFYDDPEITNQVLYKVIEFLTKFDGVHLLLKDRHDILKRTTVPIRNTDRKVALNTDVAPEHLHHNWRYRSQK